MTQTGKSIQNAREKKEQSTDKIVAIRIDVEQDQKICKIHDFTHLIKVNSKEMNETNMDIHGMIEVSLLYETDNNLPRGQS